MFHINGRIVETHPGCHGREKPNVIAHGENGLYDLFVIYPKIGNGRIDVGVGEVTQHPVKQGGKCFFAS